MGSDLYSKAEYSELFQKRAEDRTEFTEQVSGRKTSLGEELIALSRLHGEFPEYFPEPVYAAEKNGKVSEIWMEEVNLDTRLEYAILNGYSPDEAEDIYTEVFDLVTEIHEDSDLMPHGDLIGNVWITEDQRPVLLDPRGVPENREEELRWMREDYSQMDWIKNSLKTYAEG